MQTSTRINLGQSTVKRDFPRRRAACCALRTAPDEEDLREAVDAVCPEVRREEPEEAAARAPVVIRADAEDAVGLEVPVRTEEERREDEAGVCREEPAWETVDEVRTEEAVREVVDEVRAEEAVREAVDEVRREEPAREAVDEARMEEPVRAEEVEVRREEPERVDDAEERTGSPVRLTDEL